MEEILKLEGAPLIDRKKADLGLFEKMGHVTI